MNTTSDQRDIRELMARYVDAVNRKDGAAWAATWAQDATWNLLGTEVVGRENILGLWQQMMTGFEFAVMMPSSCLIEISGDSANGHWYLHEYTRDLEGAATTILSRYLDSYRKVDGQWLYQTRQYEFIYRGPPDLSGDYTPLP